MAKYKTEFELDGRPTYIFGKELHAKATIIGEEPKHLPYVAISITNEKNTLGDIFIKDKDLERFAVNILRALKSKKLKTT